MLSAAARSSEAAGMPETLEVTSSDCELIWLLLLYFVFQQLWDVFRQRCSCAPEWVRLNLSTRSTRCEPSTCQTFSLLPAGKQEFSRHASCLVFPVTSFQRDLGAVYRCFIVFCLEVWIRHWCRWRTCKKLSGQIRVEMSFQRRLAQVEPFAHPDAWCFVELGCRGWDDRIAFLEFFRFAVWLCQCGVMHDRDRQRLWLWEQFVSEAFLFSLFSWIGANYGFIYSWGCNSVWELRKESTSLTADPLRLIILARSSSPLMEQGTNGIVDSESAGGGGVGLLQKVEHAALPNLWSGPCRSSW